jgi:hypothetical protein
MTGTRAAEYGDRRSFEVPGSWQAMSAEALSTAVDKTLAAMRSDRAPDRLRLYYDPEKSYAGLLFAEAGRNDPYDVTVDDLFAVSTLSIDIDARQARLLLDPGVKRTQVIRQLRRIPVDAALTDLGHAPEGSATTLDRMWDLYYSLRTLLATEERQSNHWVFAAKLCARKRPRLFPVRDSLVCHYLGDGRALKQGDGWPGDFHVDLPVFAHLVTHRDVRYELARLRDEVRDVLLDLEDLKLLDAVLWTAAKGI